MNIFHLRLAATALLGVSTKPQLQQVSYSCSTFSSGDANCVLEQGSWGDGLTTVSSQPQPQPAAPDSRTVIDRDPFATPTSAADTLTGATSQEVHAGLGKPWGGQTSAELHHDGHSHRKRGLQGTDQFGTADDLRRRDGINPEVE